MSNRVIGLDLGSGSVKAAQVLRNDDGTYVVEHQAARRLPRGAVYDGRVDEKERSRVAAIIASMVAEEPFTTKDVIVGLNSSSAVFIEEVTVRTVLDDDLAKALPAMVEAQNPALNPEDNEIDYAILGDIETPAGPRTRVMVYRTLAEYARAVAEVVEEAGLNVVGADLNALAALRATAIHNRPEREADVIIDIGANVMTILVHHNGVPRMLTLDPDAAGGVADARVADAVGIDEDDPQAEWLKINDDAEVGLVAQARNEYSRGLSKRIANALSSFLDRSDDVDSYAAVTLIGGGALIAGIGYFLKEALGDVPLTWAQTDPSITTADGGPVQRQEPTSGGEYLVALGLGTGATL